MSFELQMEIAKNLSVNDIMCNLSMVSKIHRTEILKSDYFWKLYCDEYQLHDCSVQECNNNHKSFVFSTFLPFLNCGNNMFDIINTLDDSQCVVSFKVFSEDHKLQKEFLFWGGMIKEEDFSSISIYLNDIFSAKYKDYYTRYSELFFTFDCNDGSFYFNEFEEEVRNYYDNSIDLASPQVVLDIAGSHYSKDNCLNVEIIETNFREIIPQRIIQSKAIPVFNAKQMQEFIDLCHEFC